MDSFRNDTSLKELFDIASTANENRTSIICEDMAQTIKNSLVPADSLSDCKNRCRQLGKNCLQFEYNRVSKKCQILDFVTPFIKDDPDKIYEIYQCSSMNLSYF